jgi:putative addiction module component (TIGR02574 family)
MHSSLALVFGLSPAEKLQLVEDLWDDLAATPGAVPVHDWQKKSWPVGRRILRRIAVRRFCGKKSNAAFAAAMADELQMPLAAFVTAAKGTCRDGLRVREK